MKKIILLSLLLLAGSFSTTASASAMCENNGVISGKLITHVCWTCLFPLYIAGVKVSPGGGSVPDAASSKMFCACNDSLGLPRPGVPTSMWEPARLIEFTTKPGCISSLGGIQFPFNKTFYGNIGYDSGHDGADNFQHYHYMAFPLLTVLDMFSGGRCNAGGYSDLDLMYMSELDPTWNDSTLAFYANPESAAVANPAAAAACAADAVSSTSGKPIQEMFWCAGQWGTMYPLSGWADRGADIIRGSSLRTAKTLNALHRRGLAWRTMGNDAMCEGKIDPILPKQQYKFGMLHPKAETKSTHVMGESTFRWGAGRWFPIKGEEPAYLIWRWNDCCNTL